MRRLAWAGATLVLMALSFAAGKMTLGERIMPEIVATLPNDKSQFSRELDARIASVSQLDRAKTSLSGTSSGQILLPTGLGATPTRANSFSTG